MVDIERLNEVLEQLKQDNIIDPSIGMARLAKQIKVLSYTAHAAKMAELRGIDEGQLLSLAQQYVDEAVIMMVQGDGRRRLYISLEGNVAVLIESARVLTIYTSVNFDDAIHRIIKEVQKCKS